VAKAPRPAKSLFPFVGDFGEHDVFLSFKGIFDEISDLQRQGNLFLGREQANDVIQRFFQHNVYLSFFCGHVSLSAIYHNE
jgi:hypothetical protein